MAAASAGPANSKRESWGQYAMKRMKSVSATTKSAGITQCVIDTSSVLFREIEAVRLESVITFTGRVVRRTPDTVNPKLLTGEIELRIDNSHLLSRAELLPLQVNSDEDAGEELRLSY